MPNVMGSTLTCTPTFRQVCGGRLLLSAVLDTVMYFQVRLAYCLAEPHEELTMELV